ncbi:GNAT family N-acetyltransferase [Candidatus Acetothermia bacterium]|nr:GNAT family N-acetyltransferase [Candidatus Acetothermia bacterium]MBI3643711.1 GNAT family N-acetyltransferase [Candidatus Acetothermia bacterium]
MSGALIREAHSADLQAILELFAQPGVDDGKHLSLADAKKIFEKIKEYPDYKIYVAVLNARVVGTFGLLIMDNLSHLGSPSGLVEAVVVDLALQGHGIGKEMMGFAMERCREQGCYKLALSGNLKREAAHRFYDSLGFQQHGYSFWVELKEDEDQLLALR